MRHETHPRSGVKMELEIWSGGNDGVDIAALRAAKNLGIKTGGWIPKGFRTSSFDHPEYEKLYNLRETDTWVFPTRGSHFIDCRKLP